jgi:hypothetical protein
MAARVERLLDELEQRKIQFDCECANRVPELLSRVEKTGISDTSSLIRLHEVLLFMRAFPQSPTVFRRAGALLDSFVARVDKLRSASVDLAALEPLEVSGIAGTSIEDALSYDVVSWLARRFPDHTEIVWDGYEEERLMANTWPRFLPLLEEDSAVEANVPWREWLCAAGADQHWPHADRGRGLRRFLQPRKPESKLRRLRASVSAAGVPSLARHLPGGTLCSELSWFLRRFDRLPLSAREKSELYDGLQMIVRWTLDNLRASRTRNWRTPRRVFFHDGPLIQRRHVSLADAFAASPLKLQKLSLRQGEEIIDLIHEVMAVRYRELYGTTLGDPRQVVKADVGRGVEIFLWGLPPERRLPLRAYLAGMTLKNGVPINYVEAISLFEWSEVGFNTFYTFRDGETAWIYAQALRLIRQLHNVLCFSVYPYQIGYNNDEAIESGAYWFYRKLGFRPGKPELARLSEREEKRIATRSGYRTPARTLRRLADQHVFYELPGAERGAWERFSTREIGFKVNRRMAREHDGDAEAIRAFSVASFIHFLRGCEMDRDRLLQPGASRKALQDLAVVFAEIPDLQRWPAEDKCALAAIIHAKAGPDESRYMRLLQNHKRLRTAVLKLGSGSRD